MATPQIQNDPIYSLPHLYISGLNISIASTTLIAIAPGQARDMSNNIDIPIGFPNLQGITYPAVQFQNFQPALLVSSETNGANGLDFGTIQADKDYAIYLISDSRGYKQPAGLLSLCENVGPLVPLGYDSYILLGFIHTNLVGAFDYTYISGKPQNMVNALTFYHQPPIPVLSGGTAIVFTDVDLSTGGAVPTTTLRNIIVDLFVTFIPFAENNTLELRMEGSSAIAGIPTIVGVTAGVAQTQYIRMIAGVDVALPGIEYKVTSASDSASISVAAWTGVSNTAYPALV